MSGSPVTASALRAPSVNEFEVRASLAHSIGGFVRAALVQLVEDLSHVRALPAQEFADRGRELGIRDPVQRVRAHRQEAARELVAALRATLEARDAALDAMLERLVVAGLEVQARDEAGRAPVAAPQRRRVAEVERRAMRTSVVLAEDEQDVRRHLP